MPRQSTESGGNRPIHEIRHRGDGIPELPGKQSIPQAPQIHPQAIASELAHQLWRSSFRVS